MKYFFLLMLKYRLLTLALLWVSHGHTADSALNPGPAKEAYEEGRGKIRLCLSWGIWQAEGVVKFWQPFLTTESQKDFPRTPAEMKGSPSRISVTNTASNLRAEMVKHKGRRTPRIQQPPSFHRDPASGSELRGGRPDLALPSRDITEKR